MDCHEEEHEKGLFRNNAFSSLPTHSCFATKTVMDVVSSGPRGRNDPLSLKECHVVDVKGVKSLWLGELKRSSFIKGMSHRGC